MAGPTLTPEQLAQLKKDQAKAQAAAATFTAQIAAQQAAAAELAVSDSAFKAFFDYYNTQIIGQYDSEKRAINGQYVDTPVSESDIQACASLSGGRIQPSLPQTDVVRIAQFDGTPTLIDTANELQRISDQASVEDALVNGYGGTTPVGVTTTSVITSSSTTLNLSGTGIAIAPNSTFVITYLSDLAVVKILTIVVTPGTIPNPDTAACTIQLIVSPSGTIPAGQGLTAFTGFTNGERTTKTASNPNLQPLMNSLVSQLQTAVNGRISNLNTQITALGLNQDPDGTSQTSTALTNVNTSKNFLTNYLVATNISNSGLGTLALERTNRTTDANTRVSQINSAYTGRTLNYYDARYNFANNRANTARGSLRLQKSAEQAAGTSQSYAQTLTDQANAIGSILP